MIINHKDKKYRIQFTKEHVVHGKGKKKTDRIKTICKLFLLIADGAQGRVEISCGEVTQFHADQYDKIVGKKLAMINMLDFLAVSANSSIQDKEFRTKVWKGFHNIFGAWNQPEKNRINREARLIAATLASIQQQMQRKSSGGVAMYE